MANSSPPAKKRKRDQPDSTTVQPAAKRTRAQEQGVAGPIVGCAVVGLLKGRSDKRLLEQHLQAIEDHRQHYEKRARIAKREAAALKADNKTRTAKKRARAASAHQAKVTEAIGERATTIHMLEKYPQHQLLWDFGAGTGIDQVWAIGMPNPTEYIIVEAKGPGAKLSKSARKGPQMSKRWVRNSLKEVMYSSSSSAEEIAHAEAMLQAMDEGPPPSVQGLVVQADDKGGAKELDCPNKGIYHKTT